MPTAATVTGAAAPEARGRRRIDRRRSPDFPRAAAGRGPRAERSRVRDKEGRVVQLAADLWHLFVRLVRASLRMPVFVVISIVQPIIWVLLFGQLFQAVTALPGFGARSYVQFLAAGSAVMTALFGGAYSGLG